MNVVEKDAHVSTTVCNFNVGNKFRIVDRKGGVGYYILIHAPQSCWELVNLVTGHVLKLKRGTMFCTDIPEELDYLVETEHLETGLIPLSSWSYIPNDRFNLEVNLKGLVI